MDEGLSRYTFEAIPPDQTIAITFDVDPSEVELAFATNAASLRLRTLTALLAAMVVDDDAAVAGSTP